MPTHQVNLDSLILRQPFESVSDASVMGTYPLFKLEELQRTKMYFGLLRKPDFQRETANWSPSVIVEFVRTFLDGGLIPSIIIWHSRDTNNVYIIDGAHRVSALIAWVNDDYGGGEISQKAWGYAVPDAQLKLHKKTKQLIDDQIGSFAQLHDFGLNPEKTDDPIKRRRGKAIATMQLYIQKVEGDASIAEQSFYRINSSAAVIDDTELDIIKGRRKPNAIATRALISAGKGYRYWKNFPNAAQIESLSYEGYSLLFGELLEIGPQSPDIPRAGQPYSSEGFKMILDLVNIFNNVTPAMWTHRRAAKGSVPELPDDGNGSKTFEFLEVIVDAARLVSGPPSFSGSLGLEQAVYAYGSTGKIHPAAFIASHRFFQELKSKDKLILFSVVRMDFEEFLIKHKVFLNALGHSKGSRTRPLESIMQMYRIVFEELCQGNTDDTSIVEKLQTHPNLKALTLPIPVPEDEQESPKKRFSAAVVRAKVVQKIRDGRDRCPVCGARLPPSYRSKDHSLKQELGGMGDIQNLEFTHPFCNSARDTILAKKQELALLHA